MTRLRKFLHRLPNLGRDQRVNLWQSARDDGRGILAVESLKETHASAVRECGCDYLLVLSAQVDAKVCVVVGATRLALTACSLHTSELVLRSQLDDGVQDFRVLFISCLVTKRDSFVNHADDWRVPRLVKEEVLQSRTTVAAAF